MKANVIAEWTLALAGLAFVATGSGAINAGLKTPGVDVGSGPQLRNPAPSRPETSGYNDSENFLRGAVKIMEVGSGGGFLALGVGAIALAGAGRLRRKKPRGAKSSALT